MSTNDAWTSQSASLEIVQQTSKQLEQTVRGLLGWKAGRVTYDIANGYKIQVDAVTPSPSSPESIVSITYTNPDTKGHSNENKLHLKLGELALLKHAYPQTPVTLVIGGSEEAWLPYVLSAFAQFYDEVILLWESGADERLRQLGAGPLFVSPLNVKFWSDLGEDWNQIKLIPKGEAIPSGLVRYEIADALRDQEPRVFHPTMIDNEIARLCMQRSRQYSGTEWDHYINGRWSRIEMSRNYFNPVEACVEISLANANLKFRGGVAQDVPVPSLLHQLGMTETSLSEDFVLQSRKLSLPVYIQCKASGGGRKQHGKNIQNRAKEQITRNILYRSDWNDPELQWSPKAFHWISVLDGNWGVSKSTPYKYLHMLQWAGYDAFFGASDLLNNDRSVKKGDNNPLIRYLTDTLDCETSGSVLTLES